MSSCNVCGESIPSHRKFCSKSCYGESISKSVTYTCSFCNNQFTDKPSADREYCSASCRDSSRENKVSTTCENCGGEISIQQHRFEESKNNFCSTECHNEYQKNRVITRCIQCEEEVEHRECNSRKFCSRKCAADFRANKITKECSNCSREILRHNYQINNHNNFFCSTDCRSSWLSDNSLFASENNPRLDDGRYSGFGENWPESREKIIKRADGCCENCGKSEEENGREMSVHHITPRKEFINDSDKVVEQSNTEDNLIALCQSCHMKAEHDTIDVRNIND